MITVAEAHQKANVDKLIRKKVALELGSSWPIPCSLHGKPALAFFYYASFGPPPAKQDDIYPPSWLVILETQGGTIASIEKKPVEFYGLSGPGDRPIGQHACPEAWTFEDVTAKKHALFGLTEGLLSAWLEPRPAQQPEVDKWKKDYVALFTQLVPKFQVCCYKAVSPAFYNWVRL